MIDKPYAVIVTTSASDLLAAVVVASAARQAGGVVETPLAHSQTHRQMRRAIASGARFVVKLDGPTAEILDVASGKHETCDLATAKTILADRRASGRIGDFSWGIAGPLPRAA